MRSSQVAVMLFCGEFVLRGLIAGARCGPTLDVSLDLTYTRRTDMADIPPRAQHPLVPLPPNLERVVGHAGATPF